MQRKAIVAAAFIAALAVPGGLRSSAFRYRSSVSRQGQAAADRSELQAVSLAKTHGHAHERSRVRRGGNVHDEHHRREQVRQGRSSGGSGRDDHHRGRHESPAPERAEAHRLNSSTGDRAVVHLKACKGDLPLEAAELTALTALRVNAKKAKAPAALVSTAR